MAIEAVEFGQHYVGDRCAETVNLQSFKGFAETIGWTMVRLEQAKWLRTYGLRGLKGPSIISRARNFLREFKGKAVCTATLGEVKPTDFEQWFHRGVYGPTFRNETFFYDEFQSFKKIDVLSLGEGVKERKTESWGSHLVFFKIYPGFETKA